MDRPPDPSFATDVDWFGWLARWERMQSLHLADRGGRTAVLAEACTLANADAPAILELGCGPGGILSALAERHPSARLTGLDHDPLLLAIAAHTAGRRPGTRVVDCDLRQERWPERCGAALGQGTPPAFDAVVSSTALHWLDPDQLGAAYAGAHALLGPGGVLVNADHFAFGEPRLDALAAARARLHEPPAGDAESWDGWWAAIAQVPSLASLLAERARRFPPTHHAHGHALTEQDHRDRLRAAGFGRVEKVWARYDSAVLVALR